jgi:hypothetical protein
MLNSRKPQLLDLVAVFHGGDDSNVQIGDVGAVVETVSVKSFRRSVGGCQSPSGALIRLLAAAASLTAKAS